MKRVIIAGLGMSADTLTAEGRRAAEDADVLLGAPRLLTQFEHLNKPSFPEYSPGGVRRVVMEHGADRFCILVSGDPGFYSAAEGLLAVLDGCAVSVVPGVSSLSYFFARLGRPWQDAALVSCHGRDSNLVDTVRRNKLTFALTGGNASALAAELADAGYGDLTAHVGENLGLNAERVFSLPVSRLANAGIGNLAVLLIENPGFDRRVRFGIPDTEFVRGDVPMTKAEVRAVTMSRLAAAPGDTCWDIGAGTGSVTVELALAAYQGRVCAVDQKPEAIRLIEENCRRFHIGNVTPRLGSAPQALTELPPPDAVFIGGSAGALREIFDAALAKNPRARIAANAVTIETLNAAMAACAAHGIASEITQISAARVVEVGRTHMLQPVTPVFVLSGGRYE